MRDLALLSPLFIVWAVTQNLENIPWGQCFDIASEMLQWHPAWVPVYVLDAPLLIQLTANGLGKALEDYPSACNSAMGYPEEAPGSWIHPAPVQVVGTIWRVNQSMEDFSHLICLSI